ncbi:MAG: AbgT family transporter [Ignavibacteria bacterium]|nr:AbgT family transporter [Ignavibacteria bacterium]MBT8382852.1 AbgT family transporter [Ignavibacteria bacterium]MBT8393091.1 AbgT family transporter [Ignavibacteria bacterium]NNJ52142.1 AbgT family transporter [Ignavibacteriaceae bacterium]NNL21895.1 AbgT family transporter [Ignavibacteriaceae bacterium]
MADKTKTTFFQKFLSYTEKAGNALPHPATLFALFALSVIVISFIASLLGWQAVHPGTKEIIEPVNLLTVEGLHRIILEMVNNYTSFAPLGMVLVAMIGIGAAESSGLIGAVIRSLVLSVPQKLLTFVLVFAGVLSNAASDVGYVLLIPLGGIIFLAVGRHPIAGMAAAFAGVSGGFSANLVIGTVDPLLAGLSQEAANIMDPAYTVNPTANYYFMVISTFVIALTGTWVTDKIVEPRLGKYEGEETDEKIERLSKNEKNGLVYSLVAAAVILIVMLWGMIPADGFLRSTDGVLLNSPLIKGVVALLFIVATVMGLAYGFGSGTFKNDSDVVNGMAKAMKSLGLYLVLVFFAAQFVAYFKWSNLGMIMAIRGADLLSSLGLGVIPLMILFILLSASINMLMGSASAKWALIAPIFVPMFMLLGYSPELTQVVYRIGDSITNLISPMMSFFALIIAFFQKYEPKTGIGTIISTMLPYTIFFFIAWSILLVIWILLGLPLGPDAGLYYGGQ